MVRRRLRLALVVLAFGLAATQALSAADGTACRPVTSLRYLDVAVEVTPPTGPGAQPVMLRAACLPAGRPALVLRGQDFGTMQPVALGTTDAGGGFLGVVEVPAGAEPGKPYHFALVIDDQAVGRGTFLVDSAVPAAE